MRSQTTQGFALLWSSHSCCPTLIPGPCSSGTTLNPSRQAVRNQSQKAAQIYVPTSPGQAIEPRRRLLVDPSSAGFKKVRALEERWDSNPWMRMLASPLRRCTVSQQVLPADLMICFKQAAIERPGQTSKKSYILPDRILHPKFAISKPGVGTWVTASHFMVGTFVDKKSYKRFAQTAEPPRRLVEMIEYQLRLRVLQEAELLFERLLTEPRADESKPATLEPVKDLTPQSFAYLDFRDHATVCCRRESSPKQDTDDVGGSHTPSSMEGSVVFGMQALMGLQNAPEDSDQGEIEGAETNETNETNDASRKDANQATKTANVIPSAESIRTLQRLLKDLLRANVLVDKDGGRAEQSSFTPDNFSEESSLVLPDDLYSIKRHRLTVPLFIAMLRLARFLQAPHQDRQELN